MPGARWRSQGPHSRMRTRRVDWALVMRNLALAVLPAIAVWALVSRGVVGMSPDSLFYWSAARTIAAHHTLATGVSPSDYARTVGDPRTAPDTGTVLADGSVVYPLTTWPPGYPIAVAALMPFTRRSATGAARLVALAALIALFGALAYVAAQLGDERRALFAAALVTCLPFVQQAARMMWSDTLFAALALFALGLGGRAFGSSARSGRALALAAIVAALATYVRYTGPLIVAAPVLMALWMALRDRARRSLFASAIAAVALYGALVAPLIARNMLLTGDPAGGARSPAEESGGSLIASLVNGFVRALVPWVGNAIPGPKDAIVSGSVSLAAWAAAMAVTLVAIRRTGGIERSRRASERSPMTTVLVSFAALYCAVLLLLRTVKHFDFNTRMLLPAVASVALVVACAFERRLHDAQLAHVNRVALAMVALVSLASLAATDHYLPWRGYDDPRFEDRPIAQWARGAVSHAPPGTTVRFLTVGYFIPYLHYATGGAPAAALPDVPAPATLIARSPGTASVVVLEPGGRRFRCPEYQQAYEQVLNAASDSTYRGAGFTAWWLSRTAGEHWQRELLAFAPSCRH